MKKFKILNFVLLFCIWMFGFLRVFVYAQDKDVVFNLDVNSSTIPLPKIFKPNIDLSGRGFHHDSSWPQGIAAAEVLDNWQKDIGFGGMYRLQYNLWEINESAKDGNLQNTLLANYEKIIEKINNAGGIVILDIFGTPAGLGKVLDKKSPPLDLKVFKELIKSHIRRLSCNKKYNIWYEIWSAPDLDDFFLGKKQEYFALYRAVSEAVKELEAETKINIPIGGPGTSWWFQNCDSNSVVSPEKSLIYELIKYCFQNHLPLDFIAWHAYSTDPKLEQETTRYNKTFVALVRDWLQYFKFEKDMPLIVDEWNYDSGANLISAREEKANICASFIPARLKNMHEALIDYQLYFSLEDFQGNKERVVRNVGIFSYNDDLLYKGRAKSIYNVFKMLANLGGGMFILPKTSDEFIGAIATKQDDSIAVLFYNYVDPEIAKNYLSRNIASLNESDRKVFLRLIKSDDLEAIIRGKKDIFKIKASSKLKMALKKAQELNVMASACQLSARNIKLNFKNLEGNYLYQRFTVDSSCSFDCNYTPIEEKEISAEELNQEILAIQPYSVNMIVLKKKPKEAEIPVSAPEISQPQGQSGEENSVK